MVGSVSLLGKAAGEVSAGHWSEETLQTLRLQGEISRRAWKDNLGLFKRQSWGMMDIKHWLQNTGRGMDSERVVKTTTTNCHQGQEALKGAFLNLWPSWMSELKKTRIDAITSWAQEGKLLVKCVMVFYFLGILLKLSTSLWKCILEFHFILECWQCYE